METWEQREPGFWVSNFGNMSLEKPPGWVDPREAIFASLPKGWWDTAERYKGDANGIGSMTSITNPNTGKAESLVQVNRLDANGVAGEPALVPYSEAKRLVASDPSWRVGMLKEPGGDMIDQGFGETLGDALKATLPAAAGMVLPGIVGPWLGSALGTSPLVSNALASGAVSGLTGGNPLQGALTSLAGGYLGGSPTGTDFSGLDVNPSGGLPGGAQTFPYQVAQAPLNDGPYAAAPDMTGFQTPYTPPTFGQEGLDSSAWQLPQNTNPLVDIASASGTVPYGGVQPFANIDPGPFGQNGVVVNSGTPAPAGGATGGTGGSTIPLLGAAAGLGLAGAAGNTVTSSGDVDLTGVGTEPNPYNQDGTPVPDWLKAIGVNSWADLAKAGANALPGLLGAYASSQQANTLKGLADQYAGYGAPSRARYEASMTPGFDPNTIPGYKGALENASDTLLRRLSANGGNPFGSPGGLIEANKAIVGGTALPAINEYQRLNLAGGGLANLNAAYPSTLNAASTAGTNVWNGIGGAIDDVINPRRSLADLVKAFNMTGLV